MSTVRRWFDEARALADPVERAQALCDLAFDAEQMANSDRRSEAIELFVLLAGLDRRDDLLLPAIQSADEYLVALGARNPTRLDELIQRLHARFQHLGEYERLLAVAKSLVREYGRRRQDVLSAAGDRLGAAERLRPLSGNDQRFRAELLKLLAESSPADQGS